MDDDTTLGYEADPGPHSMPYKDSMYRNQPDPEVVERHMARDQRATTRRLYIAALTLVVVAALVVACILALDDDTDSDAISPVVVIAAVAVGGLVMSAAMDRRDPD